MQKIARKFSGGEIDAHLTPLLKREMLTKRSQILYSRTKPINGSILIQVLLTLQSRIKFFLVLNNLFNNLIYESSKLYT